MRQWLVLIGALAAGCGQRVDLSSLTFACNTNADCVDSYVCQQNLCTLADVGGQGNGGTADGGTSDGGTSDGGTADAGTMMPGTDGGAEPSGPTYLIGGSIVGFAVGPLVLQNNGGNDLTLNSGAPFTFPQGLLEGAAYAVTVKSTGAGQNCTVMNGTGTVGTSNVTNVLIRCTLSLSGGGGNIPDSTANTCGPTSAGPVLELPITVPAAYFNIAKVEVVLTNLAHPFGGDVRAVLEHTTTSTRVTLLDRMQNCGAEDIFSGTFRFADSYSPTICANSSPNTPVIVPGGSFSTCNSAMQPTLLSAPTPTGFGGESVAGTWKLLLADMEIEDSGSLTGWTITFTPP